MTEKQQLNRRGEPIHLAMQRSINVGLAAKVINDTLDGVEYSPQRLSTALEVYKKTVPNYQAVAIQVEPKTNTNILDLQAQALEVGLDPSMLLPEKTESTSELPGDPPTPDTGDHDWYIR